MAYTYAMWVVFIKGKWRIHMLCGWFLWWVSDIYKCYVVDVSQW